MAWWQIAIGIYCAASTAYTMTSLGRAISRKADVELDIVVLLFIVALSPVLVWLALGDDIERRRTKRVDTPEQT